jgi:hypothetical protein
MSLQVDQLEAFDALLDVMREAAPESCVIRWPVTKAGADATGAADYDAIPSPAPDTLDLMAGGFRADYGFSVSTRVSDFTTVPTIGTMLLKGGKVSRVIRAEAADSSAVLVLHCSTPEK